jgi:hypothetical protein
MIDARKWLWILVAVFAAGIVVGLAAPGFKGCGPAPDVPVVPVVVEGPRDVILVHETADETPELSSLIVALRKDDVAGQLKAKGHTLRVLDQDASDQSNQAVLASYKSDIDAAGLPCLLIIEHSSGKVLSAKRLAETTVDSVLAALKANGG